MSIADKLTTIADNQQKVYDTGYEKGNQTGYDAGRNDEWSDFWDAFQDYGKRTRYLGAFSGWTTDAFRPKYDITFPGVRSDLEAHNLFAASKITGSLTEILDKYGVKIDFSNLTNIHEIFSNCSFSEITLYAPKAKSGYGPFGWSQKLETINLTLSDDFEYSSTFAACHKLKNLTIGNKITKKGFDVQHATELSKESILGKEATEEQIETGTNLVLLKDKYYYGGIFGALSDTTTALTVTLSKTAVNNAFETAKGNADGSTSEEWAALIATKQNWTISLV